MQGDDAAREVRPAHLPEARGLQLRDELGLGDEALRLAGELREHELLAGHPELARSAATAWLIRAAFV